MKRNHAAVLEVACLLALALLCGCGALPWRKVPLDAASGLYEEAKLTYRLDAGKLQQPLDAARIDHQTISYDQVASSPLADQSIGTLTITFPHPSGREGYALAQFTLESGGGKPAKSTSWNPFHKDSNDKMPTKLMTTEPEVHETWTLDVPREQSDHLFKILAYQGFYHNERPDAVGVDLSVKMNGIEAKKNWVQVPQLNDLVQRVRREGQLIAYARPKVAVDPSRGLIASTETYSNFVAQSMAKPGTAQANTANAPGSAFSMRSTPPPRGPTSGQQRLAAGAAPVAR